MIMVMKLGLSNYKLNVVSKNRLPHTPFCQHCGLQFVILKSLSSAKTKTSARGCKAVGRWC